MYTDYIAMSFSTIWYKFKIEIVQLGKHMYFTFFINILLIYFSPENEIKHLHAILITENLK